MEKITNEEKHHRILGSVPLYVLASFIIASSLFGILFILTNSHIEGWNILPNYNEYTLQKNFYASLDPNEKKGFLIGSSQIWALNATEIQQYLAQNNQNYTIYNLGLTSDTPELRFDTIDMIISSHPDFVAYGISDRDFWNPITYSSTDYLFKNQPITPILPDPQSLLKYSLKLNTLLDFHTDLFRSPKSAFLMYIRDYVIIPPGQILNGFNSPYSNILPFPGTAGPNFSKVRNDTELLKTQLAHSEVFDFDPAPINQNALLMIEMIKKLQENHIKVIVFTVPQQRYHLEDMGSDRIRAFDAVLDYISSQSGTGIYQFYDKYQNLTIFSDPIHVAINKTSIIYSHDVAKIILKEIER